jgi:hypothetical protein
MKRRTEKEWQIIGISDRPISTISTREIERAERTERQQKERRQRDGDTAQLDRT